MKDTKRCFVSFEFYDRTGIENYLEKQAEKGWLLEKVTALGWKFRKIEPGKIHFAVTYYPKASGFDPQPSDDQLTFNEFCEHTGWKLAASNAQMQIFYNEEEDPTPIETEAAIEVENIHKAVKKSYMPSMIIFLVCGVLQLGIAAWQFSENPLWILGSSAQLFSCICWIMVIVVTCISMVRYMRWHKKAETAAEEDGVFVETSSRNNIQIVILVFMLAGLAWVLLSIEGVFAVTVVAAIAGILGVTAIVAGSCEIMKRMKVSAKVNRTVTIILTILISVGFSILLIMGIASQVELSNQHKGEVETYEFRGVTREIYHDDLPLIIEDMIDTEYDGYSYEIYENSESPLISVFEAAQRPRLDGLEQLDLSYTVTDVKISALYELCLGWALDEFTYHYVIPEDEDDTYTAVEQDGEPWGADQAYQLSTYGELQNRWLLCYDKRIVEIEFDYDWDVTEEQKAVVGQKLGVYN